jgi:hypothetical protein
VCGDPGTTINLRDQAACSSSDPAAYIEYAVNGVTSDVVTCPGPDQVVVVSETPKYLAFKDCPYQGKNVYTFTGARRRRQRCRRAARGAGSGRAALWLAVRRRTGAEREPLRRLAPPPPRPAR